MSIFRPEFAERTLHLNPSVIREILKLVAQPDIISFAGGMPAPELFPHRLIAEATAAVLGDGATALAALQYGPSEGHTPLRQALVASLEAEGIHTTLDRVVITTGSQQGLDLVARVFVNPGDEVVVGNPTFLGALQSFQGMQAKFVTVPVDDEGMRVDVLAEVLATRRPKLIYVIPTFQNPTGVSMSDERKQALYQLASRHGVPVVEDDPYGALYFGDTAPSPLKALDTHDGVILLRTFSKVMAPGLRIGYMVASPDVLARVLPAKQSADLHSSSFNQAVIHGVLASGELDAHLAHLRSVYRQRRDRMLSAMDAHFPADCQWTRPEGGLFVWVKLPESMSAERLLESAVARKVAFIPGSAFFANGGGHNTMRINFSNASEANIDEGIRRLGEVIKQAGREATLA